MTSSARWELLGGNPQALARIRVRARELFTKQLDAKRALYPLIETLPDGFVAMLAGLASGVVAEAVSDDLFALRQDIINADAPPAVHDAPTRRITQDFAAPTTHARAREPTK